MRDRSLRSARGRCAERAGCLWVPALFVYGLSLWRGGEPPRRGLCRAYGARQDCGVRAATGDCRLCRPQRKLRQSPLCPFAFFAPKRTAEEAKAVSPDKCREAAAKKKRESRVWFSPFAQLAKAHPNPLVYEPRVSAVFRWQMPCGDDVSHGPFSEQLSEKK